MTHPASTPAAYFDAMYAASSDPWSFETRWYEHRKHALTVAALPQRRYRSGFEPGCSTGMLTQRLAERCEQLLAADSVAAAVRTATERLAGQPNVRVERRSVPAQWPGGEFDLVVLSELGYYFDDTGLGDLLDRTEGTLSPGGTLIAVHWRRPVAEHVRSGDDVHDVLAARGGLGRLARHVEDDFVLEVFTRIPPAAQSVAQREGLC